MKTFRLLKTPECKPNADRYKKKKRKKKKICGENYTRTKFVNRDNILLNNLKEFEILEPIEHINDLKSNKTA